jgi:NRPS condensation-like uncharacterized protein
MPSFQKRESCASPALSGGRGPNRDASRSLSGSVRRGPEDYPAEAFDQMQRLWGVKKFNDHQLRCVLRFEQGLEAETLRDAVQASLEAFPILGTRFVAGPKPCWVRLNRGSLDRAFVVARSREEFDQFLVSKVDENEGPQVRVCLLPSAPVSIAIKMNHMICDAADFKTYLYTLSALYPDSVPRPGSMLPGVSCDRSVRCVLRRFSLATRLKSLFVQSNQNNHARGIPFPLSRAPVSSGAAESSAAGKLSDAEDLQPFVLTRTLDSDRTESIKAYGRISGATINDILLTAYYRCLFRLLNLPAENLLRVPIMVDMRRYLVGTSSQGSLTNLTSTVSTHLRCRKSESFHDTLGRVKALMDERKRSYFGLNGFIKLDRIYRILGSRLANLILMWRLKNPLIAMTNMGVLDSKRLQFGHQRPTDAFLSSSIKYRPYFQLAVSCYDGKITLSSNLLGTKSDRNCILSLLDELADELLHADPYTLSKSSRGEGMHADTGTHKPSHTRAKASRIYGGAWGEKKEPAHVLVGSPLRAE